MLFVVAVVVAVVFVLAGLRLLARVGVLGHSRGMALGHAAVMPPTGDYC